MLVPKHPHPVARRRAVAEMTVAARQAAAIEPGHVLVLPACPAQRPAQAPAPGGVADDRSVCVQRHDTPI